VTSENTNTLIFLGMSRRAARNGEGLDLLGLTRFLIFPFFPMSLEGLQCVVGIERRSLIDKEKLDWKLIFTDESQPTSQGYSNLSISISEQRPNDGKIKVSRNHYTVPSALSHNSPMNWGLFAAGDQSKDFEILPIPAPPLLIHRPCRVSVEIEVDDKKHICGDFICCYVQPPPLTDEERRAIASQPGAANVVVIEVSCKICKTTASFFCLLNPATDKSHKLPKQSISIYDAPDTWVCDCKSTTFQLNYYKQGLHDVFRHRHVPLIGESPLRFTPLYEAGRIGSILASFEQLIDKAIDEESVQKFLEENPLFWSFLSPSKILHKPPVLTKKRADFGILTTQRVFFLVEIEKPTTRLTNQDDSISAEIQRGANQIRDWQLVIEDHRLTFLSELGLKESEVQEIRYVLIGGLARRTAATGMSKLRRSPLASKTDFYCFDELGSFLHTLAGALKML